jgi:hypothetical protein
MKRQSMTSHHSKKLFSGTAGARHVHAKNNARSPMRGGIRL